MARKIAIERLGGVWSATPTPFTGKMTVDTQSVKRLVQHHLRLGVRGLFLAGTCGEGPWMPDRERRRLVQSVANYAQGKLLLAVQVTDNSAARILDNIRAAKEDGADIAIIAPPYFLLNDTPGNLLNLYTEAVRHSPLPVGIYDRGSAGAVTAPDEVMESVCREENVILIKDSSADPKRRDLFLAARRKRPELLLFNGWEFNCVDYVQAGYDGLLLGGGIFNGHLAGKVIQAGEAGDLALAQRLQERMNRIMYDVYGGKDIECWLSGLKKLLVQMDIFGTWRNFLNYPLTDACSNAIDRVMEDDADVLFPWKKQEDG